MVQVDDVYTGGELPYIVMELIDGRSLGGRLKTEGPLSPAEAWQVMATVSRAIQHAHDKGVLHRDLKPDNVLVENESGRPLVKIGRAHV